jgi:heme exporter protein D
MVMGNWGIFDWLTMAVSGLAILALLAALARGKHRGGDL